MGHVMDLPAKKIGVSIEKDSINIEYVPIKDKDRVIAEICKAAQGADAIFLGPDPDREGEIIAWHIENQIKKASKKTGLWATFNKGCFTLSALNEFPSIFNKLYMLV